MIKAMYEKTQGSHRTHWRRTESFPLGSRTTRWCYFHSTQNVLEVLARAIREEKEIKSIHIGKKEVQLSLFTDGKILYV